MDKMESKQNVANDNLMDSQGFMMCPFNPNHKLRPHRMPTHVAKCSKINAHMNYQMCMFSDTHYFPANQIEEHQEICKYRI